MANTISAKKRIRQTDRRRERNKARRSRTATSVRRFLEAVAAKDVGLAKEELKAAISELDRAAQTRCIHRRNADRRKARLAKKLSALLVEAGSNS